MSAETPKIYPQQDPRDLGAYYARHVSAMTEEGLTGKAEIAEQLAWRDRLIDNLQKAADANAEAAQKWRHCEEAAGLVAAGGVVIKVQAFRGTGPLRSSSTVFHNDDFRNLPPGAAREVVARLVERVLSATARDMGAPVWEVLHVGPLREPR